MLVKKFISLLQEMPHVNAQNHLMGFKDREIAVVMLHMSDDDKDFVFSFLAGSKIDRIRQEIRLLKKTKVSDSIREMIFSRLIKCLEGEKKKPERRSYFKPGRSSGYRLP
ncbi:MAG: hypothetical protein JXB88_26805 [Spirochaetales bacterium]|nr:hypothetical protein [Spirochaetales bacterium]